MGIHNYFAHSLDNYFNKQYVSEKDRLAIRDQLSDLIEALRDTNYSEDNKSIFGTNGLPSALTEDEFTSLMSDMTHGKATQDDIDLLFNILNLEDENGVSDGIISADELKALTFGRNEISIFSTWNTLYSTGNWTATGLTPNTAVGPTDGSGPVTSTEPTAPTGATEPTAPTGTTEPTKPTGATEPTAPTAPANEDDGYTDDDRILTDENGNKYVIVEDWNKTGGSSKNNNCLWNIVINSYDINELMKATGKTKNQVIWALIHAIDEKHDNIRSSNGYIIYTGNEVYLPDPYEVLEKQKSTGSTGNTRSSGNTGSTANTGSTNAQSTTTNSGQANVNTPGNTSVHASEGQRSNNATAYTRTSGGGIVGGGATNRTIVS